VKLSRQSKSDLLRSVPLFSRCSKKELAGIAQLADELNLPAGKELTVQGSPAREFFILLEGAAVVRRNGRKLRDLGPGEMIGEIALLNDGPRTATVTLTEPSRVLVLTARDFHSLLKELPALSLKVLAVVGERLNESAGA
jgi:CRP-like cAMP-binding protein